MLKPAYKVTIGSESFDIEKNASALSISVDCDINIPLDAFKMVLKPGDQSPILSGDDVTVELGYEDSLETVFTGTVDKVEHGVKGVIVSGYSVAAPLTRSRVHQIYEKQTAGAIIKDLAAKESLAIKTVDDGISFPLYVVDESKSVYSHMREIAALCGFDIFLTPKGELICKKYEAKKAVPFTYGVDIIDASAGDLTPPATCVKVYGESPASFKGADTSHWLSKREIEGTAGSGDQIMIIDNPAIRDKDTADQVARSALEALSISLEGTLKTIGEASAVKLCDTIDIKEMPDMAMNSRFKVTRISHAFNMDEGFTTTFGWVKPASP